MKERQYRIMLFLWFFSLQGAKLHIFLFYDKKWDEKCYSLIENM